MKSRLLPLQGLIALSLVVAGGHAYAVPIVGASGGAFYLIDGLGLADLSSLASSIALGGVTMSNLRYSVVDGAGAGRSSFNNNVWYNDEYNNSSLYILADFRSASTSVPEPTSLALFGLGLLGIALVSRTKQSSGHARSC